MASAGDVLSMLLPEGGWVTRGNDYDAIEWISCDPITKKAFEDGFAQYDVWKEQQEAKTIANKTAAQAKLAALGLTTDDLKALGL